MISDRIKLEFGAAFPEQVFFDEKLAPYVAYNVGGPADILVFPRSEEDLQAVQDLSKKWKLPLTLIGTGTNLLIHDGGIRGVVVSLSRAFQKMEIAEQNTERALITVQGGVSKQKLLLWATELGLSGLEFSAGVPGTIGGGIFMNAGTKYGCYGDILQELRLFDFTRGFQNLSRKDFYFGYREQTAVKDSIVIHAVFELKKDDPEKIRNEVHRIITERAEKQPLDYPSCGSTFKNPEGHSAGRLIEKAGLKGLQVGGAQISSKHANFFLNKDHAKAADILKLIEIAKEKVKQEFQIELECEVIVLGEPSAPHTL